MMASTVALSTGKDPSKSDSLCDRFVTENPQLDNWIWIIEYFAKFKTELWMLHDVFEMGPKLPDYLGEHTNEMVAFRCLASLFDSSTPGESEDVVSDDKSKIEFDSSKSCDYVLQCILDEIPLSELKPGAPGLSKWNLLPFIKSKLLCLPKCAMELIIETSSEKDPEVSPCKGQEGMRIDGQETDQVTSPMGDPEPLGHGPEDGADEFSRSQATLERSNNGPGDGAEISRSKVSLERSNHGPGAGAEIIRSQASLERSNHGPGAGAEIIRSQASLERSNHGPGAGAEIIRSQASLESRDEGYENASDGHVSSSEKNRYRCVKCKESGKLLFCSSDGCTVMVHEKCVVDSPPVYDDAGNFYCSVCACSCVSAEYLQSQEEVAKAKKKLVSFLSLMSVVNKKISIEGSRL